MADDESANPMTCSGDHQAMLGYWRMVDAILGGAESMRDACHTSTYYVPGPVQASETIGQTLRSPQAVTWRESPYLPRFPNEGAVDYECRRRHAPFTNIYGDVSDNLCSKPFSKELGLDEKEPGDLQKLAENIDGQGNNLHVFASNVFKAGVDKGVHWVLVDHTNVPQGATLADERAIGARPYWVSIPAERMLAVYSAFLNGQQVIYHARIYEPIIRQSGYGEACVDRVRVFNRAPIVDEATNEVIGYTPATWELYELVVTKGVDGGKDESKWNVVGAGPITIGIIPLVPFIPGARKGSSWQVTPPLHDIAFMQIEEFQQESNLKTIKELTAFPMLAGNGVSPPTDAAGAQVVVPVGPRAVLFAPMGGDGTHGQWNFIEPTAASLTFLQSDLEKLRSEMRNLGRQPLASANLTVVTTANVSMKASSAVQAWALLLKDSLEQAWKITCMWLGQKLEPTINVHTDFGVDLDVGADLTAIDKAAARGTISKRLEFSELKRRSILSDDADWEEDQQQLAEEQQGQELQAPQAIDPVTGQPIAMPDPNKPPVGAALQ